MPILTIDLPEEAYQNAISLPAEERERVVIDAFATARDAFAAARNIPASERPDQERSEGYSRRHRGNACRSYDRDSKGNC